MKTKLFFKLGLLFAFLCCLSFNAEAQRKSSTRYSPERSRTTTKKTTKGISSADQRAIREIFKGVPSSQYRLQFNDGKSVYGSRRVSMSDVNQVKRVTNPVGAAGYIVFVVEGDDVVYVLAVGSSKLTSVLGKEKTQRLNQIMAKYKQ